MDDQRFDLVFTGELVPGADLAEVKGNLSRLFKMDPARVELLFSGKPVVLKRGLDMDAAGKYRIAMKKAGARINTVANRQATAKAAAEPGRTSTDVSSRSQTEAQPAAGSNRAPTGATTGLALTPMAGHLLKPEERTQPPGVQVQTAHLSLRPAGEELMDEDEREIQVPLPVSLQEWGIAPAGADVLKPEERRQAVAVDVDTSGLDLAEPGDRLEAPKAAPPPPPDTSQFSLAETGPDKPGGVKRG